MNIQLGDLSALPIIIGYAVCSSMLSVVNKAAIDKFTFPTILTGLQFLTCVVVVLLLVQARILKRDPFEWSVILAFLPAAICFYLALFTNTKLLQHANVDTFIVFRSAAPIMVAVADTIFRREAWPSLYTFGSLATIFFGALGYVLTDNEFTVPGYSWAFAYLAIITFDMVYIKHIVSSLGISTWGLVLYNNAISLALTPVFWLITGEFLDKGKWETTNLWDFWTIGPVLLSCVFGFAISFYGFSCRRAISATSFTVLGVANKIMTVIVNVAIWDKHASPFGIFCLLVTIFGGVLYQQSTVKAAPQPAMQQMEKDELLKSADKRSDSDGNA